MAHNIYLLKERVFFMVRGLMQYVNDRERKGHRIMGYLNEMNNNNFDLSKVRDRGSKKWVAMMLPEHVQLIRQYNEDTKKIPRPNLDEFDLLAIQEQIEIAMKRNVEIKFKIWKDGEVKYSTGTICWIDLNRKIIEVEDKMHSFQLNFDEIVDVTLLT